MPARRAPPPKPLQVEIVSTVDVRQAGTEGEPRLCARHRFATSSVHDSELPEFSPDIRDNYSALPTEDSSSDYVNAKQREEYVNEQARAVEAEEYTERMVDAVIQDANFKKSVREKRLEAIEKGMKGESSGDPVGGAVDGDSAVE